MSVFKQLECMTQPSLINLHPNDHSQELHYYPFTFKLYDYNDLSNEVCVPNKAEDLNLSVFSMITRINESKTLTKHISSEMYIWGKKMCFR